MSMAQANIKVLNQISRSSTNASACLHPLFRPTFTLYTLYPLSVVPVFFSIGEFLQKFDLKNVISTTSKDFRWEKMVQIRQIQKRKENSNRQISTISSSRQPRIQIERSWVFFLLSYLVCSQKWLNWLVSGWSPPWLHHKILKKNLEWYLQSNEFLLNLSVKC